MTELSPKKLFWVMALLPIIILGLTTSASAEVRNFGVYTINVPSRWNVNQVAQVVTLTSPDHEAIFFITEDMSQDQHVEAIKKLSQQKKPISLINQKRLITITALRWERVVVSIMGDHPDRIPIYRSIKVKQQHPD